MPTPDLDWTFEHIPAEAEAPLPPAKAGGPQQPRRAPRHIPRRIWAALLLIILLASGGAAVYVRSGWLRLQAEVTRAVVYEDERARAGQVALAPVGPDVDGAWQRLRVEQAALGLPAPLPAGHLLPAAGAPRVLKVDVAKDSVFVATVERDFTDSSGQSYRFVLEQRYRNRGPGLWERLPPDVAPLAATVLWTGQRLEATLPAADWPLLQTILPKVDALLVRNCADWGEACQDFKVPVVFLGSLSSLTLLGLPVRGAAAPGPYPVTFDLVRDPGRVTGRVVLPSPHLAGVPQDAAASDALTRAVTAGALLAFGDWLAGPIAHSADLYRDALIARAEIRLGLSAAPGVPVLPAEVVSPAYAWGLTDASIAHAPDELALHLQALSFVNFALLRQRPAGDSVLLRTLRVQPDVLTWLAGVVGASQSESLLPAWIDEVNARSDPDQSIPLSRLGGLAFGCQARAWLVRDGLVIPLPSARAALEPEALSPDGRRLAFVNNGLAVADVDSGRTWLVSNGDELVVLGWANSDRLIYLRRTPRDGPDALRLMSYQPSTGEQQQLAERPVPRVWLTRPEWTGDRTRLALTLAVESGGDMVAPALVPVTAPDSVQWLAPEGHSLALSPDGTWAAYVANAAYVGGLPDFGTNIELYNLHTDEYRSLVTTQDLKFGTRPASIAYLTWSPDSRSLAFAAYGQPYGAGLFVAAADGSGLRQLAHIETGARSLAPRFSADGLYLTYFAPAAPDDGALNVLEMSSGALSTHPAVFGGAWSPSGHLLAFAGQSGLYVADAATNARRWLSFEDCQQLAWYPLR